MPPGRVDRSVASASAPLSRASSARLRLTTPATRSRQSSCVLEGKPLASGICSSGLTSTSGSSSTITGSACSPASGMAPNLVLRYARLTLAWATSPVRSSAEMPVRLGGRVSLLRMPAVPARAAIVSGYFNPLHIGHLEMMEAARDIGGYLVVIVNNDAQQEMKKGKVIFDEEIRLRIVRALRVVDEALIAVDSDGTVAESLRKVR